MRSIVLTFAAALFVLSLVGVDSVTAQDPDPSLVAQWHMNEATGAIIHDSSGNNNHGTIYGASWTKNGAKGAALVFDGIDDYVEVPYSASYDVITDLTVMVWIRCFRSGPIIARDGYPAYPRSWFLTPHKFWMACSGLFPFPSPGITDESWHHFAVTYHYVGPNNSQVKLYVDGNMQAAWNDVCGPLNQVSQIGLRIGASSWGDAITGHFKGLIDEVAIYNRALAEEEISDHYQQITPDQPPVAKAGLDQILRCSTGNDMRITLDGTGSYDPEDAPLTYHWTWHSGEATGASPNITLPLGTTTIKLVVNDGKVDSKPDYVNITIIDISDANWSYRVPITIDNTTNPNSLTDFQTLVVFNTAAIISEGKMQTDCNDIRFITSYGTPMAYWIESGKNTTNTKIWVKVPSIPAGGTLTIYMYYGNPEARIISNGNATFEFFDDFDGEHLDIEKWDFDAPEFLAGDPRSLLEVRESDLHLKTIGYPYDPPGITVWSKYSVMQPPLIMETIDNLYLNTGSSVNCQLHLSDVEGHIRWEGAKLEYLHFTTYLRGWVLSSGSGRVVFQMTRPISRFRAKYVVQPDGTIEYYVDGDFKGKSPLQISTSISYRPAFFVMWKADYKCDKIFFRKYATPEPTFSLGQEEETNQPPTANAGPDQAVEQQIYEGTEVTQVGHVTDPDGDALTYEWKEGETVLASGTISSPDEPPTDADITLTYTFPLGEHTVTLTVSDGKASSSDDVVIKVKDTTPPEISVSVSPDQLWPPNHKMVEIVATVTVSDICDPEPDWELFSIESNEPEEGPGKKHYPDIMGYEVGTPDTEFQLRAERLGKGESRIYTITYQATDASGNSARAEATVTVPHDMEKPLGSAPASYALFSNCPNPCNPETSFRFQIPEAIHVTLRVFNLMGQEIRTLVDEEKQAGYYTILWDGLNDAGVAVVSGIYLYQLEAGGFIETKKLLLLR